MPTKKTSSASSNSTKRSRRSPLASAIIEGLEEYDAYKRGEIKLRTVRYFVPQLVNIKVLRETLGLSQNEFAAKYGFSTRTLQEWEQGRAEPDTGVLAYLNLIQKRPAIVEEVLG